MNLNLDNRIIELNNTYQPDDYYKAVSDLPNMLYHQLLNSEPYIKNDSYTVYTDMTFIDLFFTDNSGNEFQCYVSFEGNHLENDCLGEWIKDADLRLKQV